MKLCCEQLELRDCPNSVSLLNGNLIVTGTPNRDIITISQLPLQPQFPRTIQINLNGSISKYDISQVFYITIDGNGSHGVFGDILTNQTALPATLVGGKGNDDLQSFGSTSIVRGNGGSDLIYAILGSNSVIDTGSGSGGSLAAGNPSTTFVVRTSDQIVPFFQQPIGSGTVFLDPNGNLFVMASNNGTETTVNQIGRQIVVTYQDGVNFPESYSFIVSQVKVVGFFGGAGNDTFVNNTFINTIAYGFLGSDTIIGGFGEVNLLKGALSNSVVIGRGKGFNDIGGGEIDGVLGTGYDVLIDLGKGKNVIRFGPLDTYFTTKEDIFVPLF